MSLKDLFGKTSEKIVANKQLQDIYKEIESEGLVEEIVTDRDRFLPAVDFSSASNFARYGSAERYYVDAITNIYENYPYDGSKKEKLEWRNKSSQLDLYIFDSIYPKTTGYVNLGSGSAGSYVTGSSTYRYSVYPQYVSLKGGPNASQTGKFEDANLYDLSLNRESNLGITSLGNTVEFWFKDNVSTSSAATNYVFCLFDMWNQIASGSSDYTRLTIEHSSSNKFLLTYVSGTKGLVRQEITFTGSLTDWHHYAFSFKNNDTNVANLDVSFYVDGNLYSTQTFTNRGNINLANNRNLKANIGAYLANHSGSNTAVWEGLGNSFGSYDEFRFWKASRTSKEIYRNWFTQTGGGANTDDSNVNLGVYYKFNEGIVSTNSINSLDAICLDSSGRVTNGTINNYALNVRNTSSAIDVYFGETLEEKDPIIFSSNPAVSEIVDYYTEVGADYDKDNNSNILYSLPSWILDESGTDKNDLTSLIQIIASYFDTVHNQINELPKIKNIEYTQQGNKPKPFTNKLLTSAGFQNIEIFNDINFLEEILSRNEGEIFEDKLHNIKNVIYQNIYNNLAYIYKTKGTEKSLRNLIRCFGVDDELVKINLYANNAEYELSDKYNYSSVAKKFLDLNDADRYDGFVVQKKISGDNDTSGYIVGNTSFYYVPLTAQAEVIFPKKVPYDNPNYDVPDFSEVSVFGAHTAQADENDLTWTNNPDLFNFDVFVVKPSSESNDGYFKLVTTIGGVTSSLTTSYYNELYENEKWNLAVRLYPNKYGFSDTVGGTTTTDYTLEFIGYNSLLDNVQNEFKLSLNVSESFGKLAMQANKRFYAGALYTDFSTGSSQIARSDVKISSVRVWMDYLSDTELKIHSYDAGNVGRQFPNWDPKTIFGEDYIATKIDTLALNWDFFNVTSSDTNGQFTVQDVSSGSYELATNSGHGSFGLAAKIRHTGFGDNFYPDDNQVVNKEYIFSARQAPPETVLGSDMIQTPVTDDVNRPKAVRPLNFFLSVEKSMSQIINDEIMNWFATIKDFNNLIGEPVERYRAEYRNLEHLRKMFFSKVKSEPDFERFLEFYKWIDSSISMMMTQLLPMSADASSKVRNIVESHLLERNKYENKAPILFKGDDIVSTISTALNYSYEQQKSGTGTLWLKQRAERSGSAYVGTPLEPYNDLDREVIRQIVNSKNLNKSPVLYDVSNNRYYDGKKDQNRIFSQQYRLLTDRMTIVEDTISSTLISNKRFTGFRETAEELVNSSSGDIVSRFYKRQGNYTQPYEYLQMVGRTANNKSFVDLTGSIVSTTSSLSGVVDRTLPTRNTYKNVIVERFSAPGGPEVLSRGALDRAAEEYSSYNDLNSRNIRVRKQLRSWLAESASYDSVNPSIHKVNKNVARRPTDATGNNFVAKYDNDFVTHQIPQSDQGYSWISSSLSTKPRVSGYVGNYDNLNAYNTSSFQFISASTDTLGRTIDYNGLNTVLAKFVDTGSLTVSTGSDVGINLNSFLANTNGKYGHPTWKQIRKDGNKLVQLARKANKILAQDTPTLKTKVENGYKVQYSERRAQTFTSYKQPSVTFNKPMKHSLFVTGSEDPIDLISTYDNNKEKFSNEDLARATGIFDRTDPQAHDVLVALDNGAIDPKPELYKLEYNSLLYPSDKYAGLSDVRIRSNYEDWYNNSSSVIDVKTYWRDDINERSRSSINNDLYIYNDTSYQILPVKKPLIIYNDEINYDVNILSGSDNTKESIFGLDYKCSFTSSSNAVSQIFNGREYLNNIAAYKDGEFISLGGGIRAGVGGIISVLSSSLGLYAAGFVASSAISTKANPIFFWNGFKWQNVGTGSGPGSLAFLNTSIYDMVSGNDGLYVGGNIDYADGSPSKYVAKWNGTNWVSTGTTLNGLVRGLASGSNGLYAVGDFAGVTTPPTSQKIALYNGSSWDKVGVISFNSGINTIVSASSRLFVGGSFNSPYGLVAQYTVAGGWQAMGNGLISDTGYSEVTSMISGADGVYAVGNFNKPFTTSSPTYYGSAKWDGTTWQVINGDLLEGGGVVPQKIFSGSSGIYASREKYVYKLNTSTNTWELFFTNNHPIIGNIRTISSGSEGLYFAGDFDGQFGDTINNSEINVVYEKNIKGNLVTDNLVESVYNIQNSISIPLDKVSIFDITQNNIYSISQKQEYIKLTEQIEYPNLGYNPFINSSFSSSDGIYVAGQFSASSDISSNAINLVKWNGNNYQSFNLTTANIISNQERINTILSASNGIYIGGLFDNPGYNIARWDGSTWVDATVLGGMGYEEVFKIISGSDGLYACGTILVSNGSLNNGIVKLDYTFLPNLDIDARPGTNAEPTVLDMFSASNGIYYVGKFNYYNTNFIGFYNGNATLNLGTGLDDYGYAVYSGSNGVYAGGSFISAGGVQVNYIARWNGSAWSSLAGGLNGRVLTITSHSSGLYVGGEFTADNAGNSLNNIARWNGSSWERLGSNSNSNGYGVYDGTYVKNISILPNNKLLIVGKIVGTRSGATIKDKNFNYSVQGYNVSGTQIMPTPQLTFNNFIPPSSGSLTGMKIIETSYNSSNRLLNTIEYTSSERINIINENYRYEIENKSGKTPFFNSYADYLGGLKSISVRHSLVPEYTISEHIKTYVTEKNGDFSTHLGEEYLKLNGAEQEEGYENINSSINTTNNLKPELIFNNSKNNENINLNLKISGIKKLLPYRDFYPSERVIKLGSYFINSFLDLDTKLTSVLNQEEIYSSSLSNGTPINQQILTLLQPMMSPGILLNTIKSSIAVDWPAFITKSVSYDTFSKPVFYAETGSNLITKKVINPVTNMFSSYTASNYIDKEFSYRFPFESIIEFDTRIPQELKTGDNNLYYLNPTHYTSDAITGSDYGLFSYPSYNMDSGSLKSFSFRNSNYKLAIHNFLAEIPNFFLNGKLSNIISVPESKFETARAGVTYYMDVVLEKDSKYKEFIADPYYEGLKAQAGRFSDGTLLLPSPDSLYGPPTRYWNNVNPNVFFARSPYNFYSKLLDTPAYAPYVPPYYYGKAIARISFTPTDSRKYSLSEIQKLCTVEYINSDADVLFARHSNFISGNFSAPYGDNYSSSPAYKQMMKLSSSVNLFLATDTKLTKQDPKSGETFEVSDRESKDESWVIQTKFETPSINFIESDLSDNIGLKFLAGTKENGSVKGIYSYMMKGLWTTYGRPVENGSGIKLYIQQSFEKFNENLTGSLIDLCGFRNVLDQKKTIGLLAERKKVSEGIVTIPYTYSRNHGNNKNDVYAETLPEILGENGIYSASQTGNGPYYYKIDKRIISRYLGGLNFDNASFEQIKKAAESSEYQGNSIIKLINSMTKYVIPPHLDWLRNKNITPFIMYIADFSTEFDKQDLSDIWQGVMPKQSYKAELDEVSINHKFEVGEMFHSKRPQDDTKFKVFKVKQRANINYYKLTDDSKDDDRFKFTFGNSQQAVIPEYSYNWPYDFFSLVELVNIEASLKVDNYPQTTVARENEERRRILNTVVTDLGPLKREDVKELASMKEAVKKDKVKAKEERLSPKTDKRDLPNPLTDPKPKKGKKKRGD